MNGTDGHGQDDAARARRRARDELLAERASAARVRALRRVGLRAPSSMPVPRGEARSASDPPPPD
jgi:hypothetical protein